MSKKGKYYHIYIEFGKKFPILNITDIDPYYSTLFQPYHQKKSGGTVFINGRSLYIHQIAILKVYKTNSSIQNISEVYIDVDDGHFCVHDSQKHNQDISAEIMAEATKRMSRPSELLSMIILSNRVLGIAVCLISLLSVISTISSTGILGKTQLGISSFIFIESLPLVLFGKWEWNNFGKLATLIGVALTIALPLLTG